MTETQTSATADEALVLVAELIDQQRQFAYVYRDGMHVVSYPAPKTNPPRVAA